MTKDSQDTSPATKADIASVNDGIRRILDRLDKHDKRFDSIDDRFDAVDQRFDYVDRKIEQVCESFTPVMADLGRLEDKFDAFSADQRVIMDHEKRLQVVEKRLGV